jgi:hypothetical protein
MREVTPNPLARADPLRQAARTLGVMGQVFVHSSKHSDASLVLAYLALAVSFALCGNLRQDVATLRAASPAKWSFCPLGGPREAGAGGPKTVSC